MFFSLIGFALVGNRSIPALLTGRSGSASEVAQIFSAALIFRVLGWAALDSITRVLQPYTVLDQHRGAMARVLETTQAAVLATNSAAFSFVLIMLSFGVPLSALWLGDSGRIEFGVIAPFAIAFMLDVSLLPIANTLIALNRQRRLAIVMFAQPILLIFFTRLVTPIWFSTHPVRGLLLSVVLSSAATVLLFVVVVARDGLELSARQFGHRFLPRMLVPLSVVVATAMALAAFQPVSLVMSGVVFLVVGIGMGFAVWRFLATGAERAAVLGLLRVGAGRPL